MFVLQTKFQNVNHITKSSLENAHTLQITRELYDPTVSMLLSRYPEGIWKFTVIKCDGSWYPVSVRVTHPFLPLSVLSRKRTIYICRLGNRRPSAENEPATTGRRDGRPASVWNGVSAETECGGRRKRRDSRYWCYLGGFKSSARIVWAKAR